MIEKNKTSDNVFDLFEIKSSAKKRTRQAIIMQTWSTLASIDYTDEDYNAWFSDLSIDDMNIEKALIEDALASVVTVQQRFNQECERRRLRRVK